jgi:hypothetical protein
VEHVVSTFRVKEKAKQETNMKVAVTKAGLCLLSASTLPLQILKVQAET